MHVNLVCKKEINSNRKKRCMTVLKEMHHMLTWYIRKAKNVVINQHLN